MSNPAVFELVKMNIENQVVCIEDNIGEAIHLHIGPIRVDMTVKEFEIITNKMRNVLNRLIEVENFDILNYDSFFIKRIALSLPHLKKIENSRICIADLKMRYEDNNSKIITCKIEKSPLYYYFKDNSDIEEYEEENFIFQNNKERADFIYNFILEKKENYRKNKICIDKDGFILDGYKSICALANIEGIEKTVDVELMHFEKNYIPIIVKRRKKQLW